MQTFNPPGKINNHQLESIITETLKRVKEYMTFLFNNIKSPPGMNPESLFIRNLNKFIVSSIQSQDAFS